MARASSTYVCHACGHEALAWSGRCAGCGEWNTLVETSARAGAGGGAAERRARGAAEPGRAPRRLGAGDRPAAHRRRRARPRARRRARPGLAGPARRLARDRQVDADRDGAREPRGRRPPRLYVSGEESAAQVRLRAERLGEAALGVPALAETSLEAVRRDARGRATRRLRDRLGPDASRRGDDRRARLGRAGARGGRRGDGGREADRLRGRPRRARDQGGRGRRPARARAPGRLRPAVRGRARAQLPHPARAQEPLRRDQRGRGVRDALRGAGRGRRPIGALRRRGERRAGLGRARARWRGRGRCSSRFRRSSRRPRSCRRAASPTGSTATGWRWCSRCSPVMAARRWPAPTCSSTSPAASASTSRAPTSRSRWRSSPRTAASRSPTSEGRPLACFGEVGLTGELRQVAHADRRVAEAVEVRALTRPRLARGERIGGAEVERDALRRAARLEGDGSRRRSGDSRLTSANPTSPHGIRRNAPSAGRFAIMIPTCRSLGMS